MAESRLLQTSKSSIKLTDLVIITNGNVTPGDGGNNGPLELRLMLVGEARDQFYVGIYILPPGRAVVCLDHGMRLSDVLHH